MHKKLSIVLLVSFLRCGVFAPPEWEREGWDILWHDEFDNPELNRENWNFHIGGNSWGNAE